MQNKTLRRIFTKTMSLSSTDELTAAISADSFKDNLLDAVATLDKAFTDLDRVIDIRDRSLAISSKEMTALNEEISAQALQQQVILEQLRGLLELLSSDGVAFDTETDMNKLVEVVDGLVKGKIDSAIELQILFEEGLSISSVMSFRSLEVQLQNSLPSIMKVDAAVKVYFAGFLFGAEDGRTFYSWTEQNQAGPPLVLESLSKNAHYVNINSTKGSGTMAMVQIEFVLEPRDPATLLGRIQPILPSVAATLENMRLMQDEKRKLHLESEMQTARFVQQALLPSSRPLLVEGALEVSGYYQSASECGGDWWSYFQMTDGRHIVLVGDVTGHGTGSAMVCAVVKGYCDSFMMRSHISLSTMISELNAVVYRLNKQAGRAMTMAAVAIDIPRAQITYVNAGHPMPLISYAGAGDTPGRTSYLVNSGDVLGMGKTAQYAEKIFPFGPGDQVIFYSDGLTEYESRNKERYGDNRLRRLVNQTSVKLSAAEFNRRLILDMQNFALGEEPKDDVTTVVVKNIAEAALLTTAL